MLERAPETTRTAGATLQEFCAVAVLPAPRPRACRGAPAAALWRLIFPDDLCMSLFIRQLPLWIGLRYLAAKRRNHFISFISASSMRSEEHTSELQSRENIVCRL